MFRYLATPPLLWTCLAASGQTTPPSTEEEPVVLSPFSVTAQESRGYGATTVSSTTRMNTSLVNTPQSVSVLNDRFLADISAFNLEEAFAYVPGVTFRSWSAGETTMRGFDTSVTYKNQTRLPIPYGSDFANIARIEIVKGPASAIAGRGSTGGLINYVTKNPILGKNRGSASVTVGSDSFKRAVADQNVAISGAGNIAGRIIAQVTDAGYWRAGGNVKSFSVFPSVLWKPTPKTEVLAQVEYNEIETPNDFGMPYNTLDHTWPPFSYTNSESYATRKDTTSAFWLSANHQVNANINVRQVFSAVQVDDQSNWIWPDSIAKAPAGKAGFSPGEVYFTRRLQQENQKPFGVVAQGDLLFEYKIPRVDVTARTLVSYEWTRTKNRDYRTDYALTDLSLTAPIYGTAPFNPRLISNNTQESSLFGYLISEQLGFFSDRILLSGGFRWDRVVGTEYFNYMTNSVIKTPDAKLKHPRAGVVVKVLPNVSLYAVYSKNQEPTATVARFPDLTLSDPRNMLLTVSQDSVLRETGVKGEFFGGNLTATFALFKLQRFGGAYLTRDRPGPIPSGTEGLSEMIVSPADASRGYEIEVTGQLFFPQLTGVVAFNHINTERSFSGKLVGFRGVPDWRGSMFLNYDLRSGGKGLQLRAGAVGQGRQWGDNANTFRIGSGTRWDVGWSYSSGNRWNLSMSVNNITSAIFVAQFQAFRANSIYPPREIRLTFDRSW